MMKTYFEMKTTFFGNKTFGVVSYVIVVGGGGSLYFCTPRTEFRAFSETVLGYTGNTALHYTVDKLNI